MALTSHAKALFNFIKEIYGPQIAVLATNEVRGMFWRNGLTIKEFFEPFSNLNIEWTLRDPSGLGSGSGSTQNIHSTQGNSSLLGTYKLRTLHLNISEVAGPDNPPQNTELFDQLLHEELNDIAIRLVPDEENTIEQSTPIPTSSSSYPWYSAFRKCWLHNIPVMEHEYIRYYVSVILMVSSHQSDPIAIFEQLNLKLASIIQKQQETKPENRNSQPKFLADHLIKTYVLLHDVSNGDLRQAEAIYVTMQSKYSPKYCHFLKMNSNSPTNPDPAATAKQRDLWMKHLLYNRDIARRMNRKPTSKITESDSAQAPTASTDESHEPFQEPNPNIPPNPIIHEAGQFMSQSDIELVTQFLHDYVNWSLLPHLETLMRVLYEKVNSHNKISRLFSSFKKYTSNKGATTPHVGLDQFSEIYTSDSVELHTRMLADISFLLQNWDLAYNMYHSVKKDYQGDQAWWLYAGAVEMTALSVFMLPTIKKDAATYFDECFQQYLTICKSIKYALRALMLWGEMLKAKALYLDAAIVYTKLGGKVDDLCSAMLLEQAALCVMSRKPIRARKGAQLMVLSSHMYTKSNHPRHSVRLLKQSLVSLQGRSWIAAEDYLLFLLGKHSSRLGKKEFAYTLFESLLSHDPKIYFQFVPPIRQEEILREFLVTFQENSKVDQDQQIVIYSEDCSYDSTKEILPLPIPKVDCTLIRTSWSAGCLDFAFKSRFDALDVATDVNYVNAVGEGLEILKEGRERSELVSRGRQVLLKRPSKGSSVFKSSISLDSPIHQPPGGFKHKVSITIGCAQFAYSGSLQTSEWRDLEMSAVRLATGKKLSPISFRSLAPFLNPKTNNLNRGICVSQECICVEIFLRNPLNVSLVLSDIALQWVFESEKGGQTVLSEIISIYKLPACGQRLLQLQLQPLTEEGILYVTGLLYSVEPSLARQPVIPESTEVMNSSVDQADEACHAQGVLELSVRGNRLNETKMHKTNLLYAPDYRLQWEIVPAMPRILLRFQHWPTHLLSGEIFTIPVELYNCGSLPLHNPIVSSPNYASFLFNFNSKFNPTEINKEEKGFESIQLDSNTNFSRNINLEPLLPANGAKGTLVLKAPDLQGEYEYNFLFYYDTPLLEGQKKHPLTHRINTHTAYVQIVPSIQIQSSISQTNIDEDNTIKAFGSFTIENIGKDGSPETYQITSIIAVSKEWRVNIIPNTYDESSLGIEPGTITQLYYLATKNNENIHTLNSNVYTIATLLEVEKSSDTDYNFDLLSHQNEFKSLANSQGQFSILFLIKWRTVPVDEDSQIHYGTCYISPTYTDPWKDPMLSLANIDKPNDSKQKSMARSPHQLINYVLIHPNSVSHNFAIQPLCFQKVQVNLQNISGQIVFVTVQFNLPQNETKRNFCWVGNVVIKVKLQPFEFFSSEHKIVFSGVGVYNIMNFTITASTNQSSNFLPQFGPKVSYIFVENNCNTLMERK